MSITVASKILYNDNNVIAYDEIIKYILLNLSLDISIIIIFNHHNFDAVLDKNNITYMNYH